MSRLGAAHLLAVAYVGGGIGMWGTFYDTAWHRTLALDTFWSLPHLFMYGGGFVVWVAVTTAIVLASRGQLADVGGPVWRVGRLRLPFGFALAMAGVVIVIGAAPVDIWYHGTFGKDVLIWSPPHMQAVVGGMVAGAGLFFAAAAQRGRGALAHEGLWTLAITLPAVHFIHLAHYALAHYTMTPATRTPDFYPFLVALMFPAVLVASARAAGPMVPLWACLLFLAASVSVDRALEAIEFERYTITPVIAVPALAVAIVYVVGRRVVDRAWLSSVAGLAFVVVFLATEAAWMARVVGQPWSREALTRSLPVTLVTGALSGFVGWVWGGFARAPYSAGGVVGIFGTRARAVGAAVVAFALVAVAVLAVYRPQVFGPPMALAEFALEPASHFPVQEAVFWEAVLDEDWAREPRVEFYSEGIIDGIPLPIGPAWCAADPAELARDVPRLRFAMHVNGVEVDLRGYPLVPQRLRDGRVCSWVGVISRAQRASRNRFVYTITPVDSTSPVLRSMIVEATVVFKDP